jgi:predicted dehydrogenase
MSPVHARSVRGSPAATLCGIVDRDQATADAMANATGAAGFVELADAIAQTNPIAAVIATPDRAHRESAEIAIGAGLHVLVEKPLATTVEDAEALVRHAEERGVRLMPGHSLRVDHRNVQLAEAVSSGRIGAPLLVRASRWIWASHGADKAAVTTPLWYVLIHDIDLIHWIAGGLTRVVQ